MNSRRNKGQSGAILVLILVVIVVGAYFAIPTFQSWIQAQWTKVKDWWNSNYGSYFTLQITYSDGTTRNFDPSESVGLSIVDSSNNLKVTSVKLTVNFRANYTGVISSYKGSFGFSMALFDTATDLQVGAYIHQYFGTFTGVALTSGALVQAYSYEYMAANLESRLVTYDKDYYFKWVMTSPLTLTLTFSDGNVISQTNTVNGDLLWHVKRVHDAGFTSLSVDWGRTAI